MKHMCDCKQTWNAADRFLQKKKKKKKNQKRINTKKKKVWRDA